MEENNQPDGVVALVLLDGMNFNGEQIRENLQKDWGIVADTEIEKDTLLFKTEEMTVAISHMPLPIPDHEAEEKVRLNFLWKDGVETVSRHQSHILVAVLGDHLRLVDRYCLLTKVAASCLKLPDATAVCNYVTVLPANAYLYLADFLKNDWLPVANWVLIGVYAKDEKWNAYTYGMFQFGKDEIEVVGSDKEGEDLYEFLHNIAEYVIETDVELKDGETIGFSEEQKLAITRSEGVSVDGDSLKIAY